MSSMSLQALKILPTNLIHASVFVCWGWCSRGRMTGDNVKGISAILVCLHSLWLS